MSVMFNPFIFLSIGAVFAVGYALIIVIGWAITRRNRQLIQESKRTLVPVLNLGEDVSCSQEYVEIIGLRSNLFLDKRGQKINVSLFKAYVAEGESERFPDVRSGDLLLFDDSGELRHVFQLPDISTYR